MHRCHSNKAHKRSGHFRSARQGLHILVGATRYRCRKAFRGVDRKVRSNHEQSSARCAERLKGFRDEGVKPRTCLIEATLKAKSPVLNVELEKTCHCVGGCARFVLIIVTIANISYRDGVEREEQLVSCRAIETSSANRCRGWLQDRAGEHCNSRRASFADASRGRLKQQAFYLLRRPWLRARSADKAIRPPVHRTLSAFKFAQCLFDRWRAIAHAMPNESCFVLLVERGLQLMGK